MIDRSKLQRVPEIRGDDDEDTRLLVAMAEDGRRYLTSHDWCPPIRNFYLAHGAGGVAALFLVEFSRKISGSPDDTLWLVVGDLPTAYFVTEDVGSIREAFECYCSIMDDWVSAVQDGRSLEEVYPVEAAPTEENARELASRLQFLRSEILPSLT